MDLQKYRELAARAARRAGPGLFRIFAVYAGVLAVLSAVGYLLENPVYEWQAQVMQYVSAGNFDVPELPARALQGLLLSRLLEMLGWIVTAGWVALTLAAARG